jgi:DTW domain-containing protein YfiP
MEYKKEKVGTGRFSHLILKNSHVFVDVNFDNNEALLLALRDPEFETFLLYPGDETIDLSERSSAEKLGAKNKQFIIIDGTWPCAKKMVRLSTCLHHLPRVSFKTTKVSEFKIKHQPFPGCLSTVESIYQVIQDLNALGIEQTQKQEENLLEVFRESIQQQIDCAQDPARQGYRKKAYSLPENRKISRKWSERLLFFRTPTQP